MDIKQILASLTSNYNLMNWSKSEIIALVSILIGTISAVVAIATERRFRKKGIEEANALEFFTEETIKTSKKKYILPNYSYQDPSAEEEPYNIKSKEYPLFDFVDKFLLDKSENKYLMILSDTGMGKTSFLINYYIKNRKKIDKNYKISLIPFGISDFEKAIDSIRDKKHTILFLDAFDEDLQAIENPKLRIEILMKKYYMFYKIIITCRTQFFHKMEDIPTHTGLFKLGPKNLGEDRGYNFQKLYLSFFNDNQIKEYLNKIFFFQNKLKRKAFELVKKVPYLSMRPMLLTYIPELINNLDIDIKYTFQIYEIMVYNWIRREFHLTEDRNSLRAFSEQLAFDLYNKRIERGAEGISVEEMSILSDKWKIELEKCHLTSRSLLNRGPHGNYKFAHRSIMEYLYVKYFLKSNFQEKLKIKWSAQMKVFFLEMYKFQYVDKTDPITGLNFGLIDLSDMNLENISFKNISFKNADFENSNLKKVDFTGAKLISANLKNCDLRHSKIIKANLNNANLENANLQYTDIWESNLENANLNNSNIHKASLRELSLNGINLPHSNLRSISLKGFSLNNSNLSYADLSDSDLTGTSLKNANMKKCILKGTKFKNCKLMKTDLSETKINNADFTDCKMNNTNFQKASIEYTKFTSAELIGTVFVNTKVTNSDFSDSTMEEVEYTKTKFKQCFFTRAKLNNSEGNDVSFVNCDLKHACLNNLNFLNSIFQESNLSNANLSYSKFQNAQVINSIAEDAVFFKTLFDNCNIVDLKLKDINLTGALFKNCKIINSDLKWAAAKHISILNSKLHDCDLRGAKLNWANISKSSFSSIKNTALDLRGSKIDGVFIKFIETSDEIEFLSKRINELQDAQECMALAEYFYSRRQYEDSINVINKALELDPENIKALIKLNLALGDLNRHEEAVKVADRILKIKPTSKTALVNKCFSLNCLQKHSEALDVIDMAIKIDGMDEIMGLNKIITMLKLENYFGALNESNSLIKLNPSSEWVWIYKGHAEYYSGNLHGALQSVEKAMKLGGISLMVLTLKEKILEALGEFQYKDQLHNKIESIRQSNRFSNQLEEF